MKKFVNLYGHPYAMQSTIDKAPEGETLSLSLFLCLLADRLTDEQLWNRFCETFRFVLHYPRVTFSEFLNVYEALNLAIDQDDDFIHLVNNTWNI